MARFYLWLRSKTVLVVLLVLLSGSASQARECIAPFLDGLFLSQMKEHKIAGITFSMFSEEEGDLFRAWGYSHTEAGRKVNEETGFMIGSASKLFVWLAVMQLHEQGKLDLNTPVNDYLQGGFRLPDSYAPVSMTHLMTHTPGFADVLHLFSKSHDRIPDAETYLQSQLPVQIYQPGTTPAYSNYGVVLAAYVVEQITGQLFNDYVDEHIFAPLGMQQTTFRQPADFVITDSKSRGYVFESGRLVSPFDEFVVPYAAGSVVSSAKDMNRFMQFLLQTGKYGPDSILKQETLTRMFTLLYQPYPQSAGWAHGMMHYNYKGLDIYGHGGQTFFFQTLFVVIPQHNTGIFFSANTGENGYFSVDMLHHILDYLFEPEQGNGNGNFRRNNGLNHYSGSYRSSRRTHGDHTQIINLFMRVKVTATPEGLLVQSGGSPGELFKPAGEDYFVHDYKKLWFERNDKGQVNRVITSSSALGVLEKAGWRESIGFNVILLLLVILISVKSVVCPFVHFFKKTKRKTQLFRWIMIPAGLSIIAFFIMFFTTFNNAESVIFEKPQGFIMMMLIPWISVLFVLLAVFFWFQSGTMGRQRLPRTLWQFLAFVVLVVFYVQMFYWNLLSYSF